MKLKTATIIALIGVLIQSVLWMGVELELIRLSGALGRRLYSVSNLVLTNGTLALFLAVLYSKQK